MTPTPSIDLVLWCRSCHSSTAITLSDQTQRLLTECAVLLDRSVHVDETLVEVSGLCASCR